MEKEAEELLVKLRSLAGPAPDTDRAVLSWIEGCSNPMRGGSWFYLWCALHLKENPLKFLGAASLLAALVLTIAGVDRYLAGLFM